MDPTTLMQLLQMHQMMGQVPGYGQQQMPQGQLPSMAQYGQPQPQLPAPTPDPSQQKKGGGFNPLMLLSPMGGMFASNPKLGMSLMSPAFGIANLLGAFK